MDAFLAAFKHFHDVHFVWKIDLNEEELEPERKAELKAAFEEHKNVHAVGWVDQQRLLHKTGTLAFITGAGINSIMEAIEATVPLLCVPVFGDQFYNAALVDYRKIGLTITAQDIAKPGPIIAVLTALLERDDGGEGATTKDKIPFKANIVAMKEIIHSAPMSPKDRFVKHVEFAAKFGNRLGQFNIEGVGTNALAYYV